MICEPTVLCTLNGGMGPGTQNRLNACEVSAVCSACAARPEFLFDLHIVPENARQETARTAGGAKAPLPAASGKVSVLIRAQFVPSARQGKPFTKCHL